MSTDVQTLLLQKEGREGIQDRGGTHRHTDRVGRNGPQVRKEGQGRKIRRHIPSHMQEDQGEDAQGLPVLQGVSHTTHPRIQRKGQGVS